MLQRILINSSLSFALDQFAVAGGGLERCEGVRNYRMEGLDSESTMAK